LDPGKKSGVDIPFIIGENVLLKLSVYFFGGLAFFGYRLVKENLNFFRDRFPDFFFTDARPIVNEVIDHLMAKDAHGIPILRV
jgi:hypothetical protein